MTKKKQQQQELIKKVSFSYTLHFQPLDMRHSARSHLRWEAAHFTEPQKSVSVKKKKKERKETKVSCEHHTRMRT